MSRNETIYPIGLRLAGRKVVVVGGGLVGTRRVRALLEVGARVVVISPAVTDELAQLADAGEIELFEREFSAGDLAGAWLAHTATGVAAVDAAVSAEAEASQILTVNAAEAEKSTAWVPAVARDGSLTVAAFGGGEPRRATALRDQIVSSVFNNEPQVAGTVALIGGGPGDPELVTLRAKKLLAGADVVVYDRLSPFQLVSELQPRAAAGLVDLIDVGKAPDNHPVPQDEINAILVREAQSGKRVVRLKGGDPYVFGRGGEELIACAEAGIEVEVVSGISSSISVPAIAGIPVTHRGIATGFTVVTGHEAVRNIAGGRDHTVVILMGVSTLADSAAALATEGRGFDCPVAIIEDGFGPNQRVTIATLGTIASIAEATGVKAPAVIVIGDVVSLSRHKSFLKEGNK
ncbi:MAG: uroporphyrinogen-III C-methyltransferase [Rhodoluna sp.]|nr:uroporphyrinogen-III C-methyltransferase [Rhodoluna sp.]